MELSQLQRDQIYLEESKKRSCKNESSSSTQALALMALLGACGLAILIVAAKNSNVRKLRLNDIRAAYEGLSPDDFQM